MHIMKECLTSKKMAFALQKDSPYKKRIDQVLIRLQESGLIKQWHDNELDKVADLKANDKYDVSQKSLNIDNFKGIFALTGILWAIAICCFLIEVALKSSKLTQTCGKGKFQ